MLPDVSALSLSLTSEVSVRPCDHSFSQISQWLGSVKFAMHSWDLEQHRNPSQNLFTRSRSIICSFIALNVLTSRWFLDAVFFVRLLYVQEALGQREADTSSSAIAVSHWKVTSRVQSELAVTLSPPHAGWSLKYDPLFPTFFESCRTRFSKVDFLWAKHAKNTRHSLRSSAITPQM